MNNELLRIYQILKDHEKDDFRQFYTSGFQAEGLYGCCGQCTVFPFVQMLKVDSGLFKYASGFCAGEGQMGQYPCGAFNGGILVLSYLFGRDIEQTQSDIDFSKTYFRNTCRLVREFEKRFKTVFDDVLCKNVQHKIFGRSFMMLDSEDYAVFEQMGGHVDKCTNVVGTSARIIARIIYEELDRML
ncbi:MAG: C-GCAxxG-C-C family protein [Christensenellales bacterium]|jgi:hypothetical protein